MKLKVLVGVLVFLIVINLATIGTFLFVHFTRRPPAVHEFVERGGPWSRGPEARQGKRVTRFRTREREELRSLLFDFRTETAELRNDVNEIENKVFELMQRDPVPVNTVDSLLKDISDKRYKISKIATAKLIEAKTVLSPEEQKMFFGAILNARPARPGKAAPHRARRYSRRGEEPEPDSLR